MEKQKQLTEEVIRKIWEEDSRIKQICENCYFCGSDSEGDYCQNSWPVCDRFDFGDYLNVNTKGDEFPFKKSKRCFQLDFWHSGFVDFVDGTLDSELGKIFWSNPSFKPRENELFDRVMDRLITAELELEELRNKEDIKEKSP